jgi:hypothetical protein
MRVKIVKVVAASNDAGGIEFEVDGMKAEHARLHLEKDSGQHAINFQLHDQTGRDLRFDPNDPIWIGEDCPCPPARGINSDQMNVTDLSSRSLETVNSNSGRGRDLRYQLNFIDGQGMPSNCDPVIRNDGGKV